MSSTPPALAGRTCQAFICQQFFADGRLVDEANVTFLKFDAEWFRLYFEPGLIFWRPEVDTPHPWEIPEDGTLSPEKLRAASPR
jgi:hypothetical protein